jgi:hypothetical protein
MMKLLAIICLLTLAGSAHVIRHAPAESPLDLINEWNLTTMDAAYLLAVHGYNVSYNGTLMLNGTVIKRCPVTGMWEEDKQ